MHSETGLLLPGTEMKMFQIMTWDFSNTGKIKGVKSMQK